MLTWSRKLNWSMEIPRYLQTSTREHSVECIECGCGQSATYVIETPLSLTRGPASVTVSHTPTRTSGVMTMSFLDPPLPAGCGSTRDPEKTTGVPFCKPASRACRSPTTNFQWRRAAGPSRNLRASRVRKGAKCPDRLRWTLQKERRNVRPWFLRFNGHREICAAHQ